MGVFRVDVCQVVKAGCASQSQQRYPHARLHHTGTIAVRRDGIVQLHFGFDSTNAAGIDLDTLRRPWASRSLLLLGQGRLFLLVGVCKFHHGGIIPLEELLMMR